MTVGSYIGAMGQKPPPRNLADQLTLFKLGGQIMPLTLTHIIIHLMIWEIYKFLIFLCVWSLYLAKVQILQNT